MKDSFPPKKIVAAFDASPSATAALAAGVRLAKAFGATLDVVYVETPPVEVPYPYDGLDARAAEAVVEEARRLRRQWLSKAQAAAASLPPRRARFKRLVGWPEDELLEQARSADLLVCGTHGRGRASRLLLGSVAEGLVRRAGIPVLCLHEKTRLHGRVLAPYNLRAYADRALSAALTAATTLRMPMTALYVASEDDAEARAQLQLAVRLAARLGKTPSEKVECRVRAGDPRVEIAAEAASGRYGLIVLSSHVGDSWADRAIGSTAERLLRRAAVPVLTVPPGRVALQPALA